MEAAGLNRPKSTRKAAEFDARKAAEIEAGALGAQEAEAAGVPTQVTWPAHRKWVYSQAPRMTLREFQVALKGRHGMSGSEIEAYYKSSNGGAEVSAAKITTEGAANATQASQAQQASPQPTQAAAPAAAAGLTDGAPTANTGAQAAPAGGTQGNAQTPDQIRRARLEREISTGKTNNGGVIASLRPSAIEKRKQELDAMGERGRILDAQGKAPRATAEQLTGAQERWQRMTTAERQAVAARADGLNPMQRKNVPRAALADLSADIQRKLADAMGASVNTVQGAIKTEANQVAELSLDEQLKQVNDQLANQGQVKNANTRAKRDQVRTAIAERDFPAILKAVDGDIDSAEAINQALQYAGDEPKAKTIERVLKNRGITDEYRNRWTERLMGEEGANNAVPAPSPGVVNVPPAIAEALDADTPAAAAAAAPAAPAVPADGLTDEVKVAIMAAIAQQPGFNMANVTNVSIRKI